MRRPGPVPYGIPAALHRLVPASGSALGPEGPPGGQGPLEDGEEHWDTSPTPRGKQRGGAENRDNAKTQNP
jgi:hypothetical protein